MGTKFKDDLVLKATLGPADYELAKKYIPSWEEEYKKKRESGFIVGYIDFLKIQIATLKSEQYQEYVVYGDNKKLGIVKAESAEHAIEKFKPFAVNKELKAVVKSTMKFAT